MILKLFTMLEREVALLALVRATTEVTEEGRASYLGHAVMKASRVHSAGRKQGTIQGEKDYRV